MKKVLKNMVLGLLVVLARIRIKRLRPFVIGVTGSVGKTSTKEAIYMILKEKYKVLRSEKSYNTEFGLPLAILEQTSGFSSASKWAMVMTGALINAFFGGRHLQVFVIEMGVDKPGDMDFLLKIVQPQMGIMTAIKPVHLAEGQFTDLEDIFNEKKKLVESLPENGVAVLNLDDPYISTLQGKLKCREFYFGINEEADLRATDVNQTVEGISFGVEYKGERVQMKMPLIGAYNIYVILPAIASALLQGFGLEEACRGVMDYRLPPGRMNLIEGIKGSMIIDSSYNASPEAMKKALEILSEFPGRRIAVLGNMNELGDYSEMKHREIGAYVINKADFLVTVGEEARLIRQEALSQGLAPDNSIEFDDAIKAAEFVGKIVQKGDTVLVKGSQNRTRLEKLVEKLMKYPGDASTLLVRQDRAWK